MNRWKTTCAALNGALVLGAASTANAQVPAKGEYVPPPEVAAKAPDATVPDGWKLRAKLGSNASFNHNRDVVGSTNGGTFQIGILFDAGADLKAGQHEWLNALSISHQQTKNPLLDDWFKSMDELTFQTTYLYHFADDLSWLGPFARFKLSTALFESNYVNPNPSRVILAGSITEANPQGATIEGGNLKAQEQFLLTDPFEPLVLRETAGMFANPVVSEPLNVSFKLGVGAQQIIVQSGFALTDDSATEGLIEVTQLQDVNLAGLEAEAGFSGSSFEKTVTWSLLANVLYPIIKNVEPVLDENGDDQSPLTYEVTAKVGAKVTSWGSVDYVLTVKRAPFVSADLQIQNGLLFSASFDLL